MHKISLGPAKFRELVTEDRPHPVEQACMVVAKNLDGSARIVVWEESGATFILDNANLIQTSGKVEAHYEEAVQERLPQIPEPENPAPPPAPPDETVENQEPATGPGGDLPHDATLI